jgi:hypothetical protein
MKPNNIIWIRATPDQERDLRTADKLNAAFEVFWGVCFALIVAGLLVWGLR